MPTRGEATLPRGNSQPRITSLNASQVNSRSGVRSSGGFRFAAGRRGGGFFGPGYYSRRRGLREPRRNRNNDQEGGHDGGPDVDPDVPLEPMSEPNPSHSDLEDPVDHSAQDDVKPDMLEPVAEPNDFNPDLEYPVDHSDQDHVKRDVQEPVAKRNPSIPDVEDPADDVKPGAVGA